MTISNIIYCQRWTGFIISSRPTLSVNCQIVICSDIPCPARPIIINWARFEENIAVCNFTLGNQEFPTFIQYSHFQVSVAQGLPI